jgi:predicted DNA-binding protein (UPF0251 family)
MPPITLEQLQSDIEAALGLWYQPNTAGTPLAYLACVRTVMHNPLLTRRAHNQVLLDALEKLEQSRPQSAELIRLRYLEQLQVAEVAVRLNIVENTFYARKPVALRQLATIVLEMETISRADRQTLLTQRLLPPTYDTLVGVEAVAETLIRHLIHPAAPWLFVIEGLGGIGKTALADRVVRDVLQKGVFGDVGWVSAQRQPFTLVNKVPSDASLTVPAFVEALLQQLTGEAWLTLQSIPLEELITRLQQRLKAVPHLIVIDNLETLADVGPLLPVLRRLMNPTKFLLTSRYTLVGEPDMYHLGMPELSETDALQLMRNEVTARNLSGVAPGDNRVFYPFYQAAGGNPLALRLLVGQLQIFDIETVVTNLAQARGTGIEALYTYIYWRTWEQLDEPSRRVFLTLPLLPVQGGSLKRMLDLCRLDAVLVQEALHQLVQFNLVDARGDVGDRRYTIHSLTRSFLQEQVAKWM